MAVKDLFSKGKTISRKYFRKNFRQDPTFQKIVADKKIQKIINRPEEQREFHDMMVSKTSDGSLSGNDMREVFGDLVQKHKGQHISSEEGRQMASEFFSDSSRRYKAERAEIPSDAKKASAPSPGEKSGVSSSNPHIYRSAVRAMPSGPNPEDKKSTFFNSLRSVERNRK